MRRALGLDGEQLRARPMQERGDSPQRPAEQFTPGHKRRFVHDGEVPVTLVHGLVSGRREQTDGNGTRGGGNAQPTNRLEVAEAALAAEIATRERTERSLQEAQASVHDLQTKLGHADLARQEAVETLRREREASSGLRASLQELEEQVRAARQAQEAAEGTLAELRERRAAQPEDADVAEVPARPRRGRKPESQNPGGGRDGCRHDCASQGSWPAAQAGGRSGARTEADSLVAHRAWEEKAVGRHTTSPAGAGEVDGAKHRG